MQLEGKGGYGRSSRYSRPLVWVAMLLLIAAPVPHAVASGRDKQDSPETWAAQREELTQASVSDAAPARPPLCRPGTRCGFSRPTSKATRKTACRP